MSDALNAARDASRRPVALATAACAFFLVYGSLVPLHLRPMGWAEAWAQFMAMPGPQWREVGRIDVAVNFLLTVPLAFGLAHLARSLGHPALRAAAWGAVWPAVAALSLGVEFAQSFFPPRDPSWTDVAAQWLGALAGLLAQAVLARPFAELLARLTAAGSRAGRAQAWLSAYLLLLLAFSVMPLDLSLSPVELYRKWRDGRVILLPFGGAWPGALEFLYGLLTDVGLWLPVGLLWRWSGLAPAAVLRRALLAAAAIELAQLLVLSRVSDVTDLLTAALGAWIGTGLLPAWQAAAAWPPARRAAALRTAWWVWLATAVLALWLPLNFRWPEAGWASAADALLRWPFQTYAEQGEFHALNEILRKGLLFLPGGLLAGAWRLQGPEAAQGAPGLRRLWLLALGLECGQWLLPGKVADLTDVLLAGLGALAGWRLAASLAAPVPAAPTALAEPAAGVAGATLAPAMPATVTPPPRGLQAAAVLLLALLLWLAGRAPGLPYNVAKLMPPGFEGLLSAASLAFMAWWMLAVPVALLEPARARWRRWSPLLLPAHALVGFAVLRLGVPLTMLHKVIGDPVLGWGGPWEDLGRYTALHACVLMPVLGAAWLVRTVRQPRALPGLLAWALGMALLFGPLHWVVVVQAGTDNLVELMRDGGGIGTSLALGTGWLLVATAGSALAAAAQPGRRVALLALGVVALAIAPLLFGLGLEPVLVKYGRAFSALQFIVSAGRDRYAVGAELALRAALALGGLTLAVAAAQALPWRAVSAADGPGGMPPPGRRRRRRRRSAAA